jgi:hypothetical protein
MHQSSGSVQERWTQSHSGRIMAVLLVFGITVGLPLELAISTGSIGIPHNDAWSHAKIAETFGRTGMLQLVGWNRTALVGQVIPLGPLATSVVVQQVFVAVLSLVALAACYAYLLRRVGSAAALLGTVLVGITPDFGLLATSFMSDVPAFAALMVCLVLIDRALQTSNPLYLAFGLLVGVWGVTIREQDLVAPVAAVAITSMAWHGRKRLVALGLGGIAAAAIGVFEVWRRSLPYGDSPALRPTASQAAQQVVLAIFTIALYVAPAVFAVARPARWGLGTRWLSAIVLVSALVIAVEHYPMVFLGNYLDPTGAYPAASVGVRADVIPSWLWLALVLVACVSLAGLVGVLLHSESRIDLLSGLVGTLLIVGTIAQAAVGQLIFGRYLLPLVPIVCAVLLNGHKLRHRVFVIPTLALLAAVSLGITANALAFDAARWQAAARMQQQGISATDINAGLEWVGYHATEPAERRPVRPGTISRYMRMFQNSRECYVVSASQLPNLNLLSTFEYRTYGLFGRSELWIYQPARCG